MHKHSTDILGITANCWTAQADVVDTPPIYSGMKVHAASVKWQNQCIMN